MHHYVKQRLSFDGQACVVKHIGQLEGKAGDWLGIEWDDDHSGKNDGTFQGRRYFHCKLINMSEISTLLGICSSITGFFHSHCKVFIYQEILSRPCDSFSTFPEALRKKYLSSFDGDEAIEISGKTVEEIGFQKIQQQLAKLQDLQTIALSRCCIAVQESSGPKVSEEVKSLRLSVRNLDLSSNLLESWMDVLAICGHLSRLSTLDLSGNRFRCTALPSAKTHEEKSTPVGSLMQLLLDNTFLDWDQVKSVASCFPDLAQLSICRNNLTDLPSPLLNQGLVMINLSHNNISKVEQLAALTKMPHLRALNLSYNPIRDLSPASGSEPFAKVDTLILAGTDISEVKSLSPLDIVFPRVTDLVTTNTPFSALPGARFQVIGHLSSIKMLNHSEVSQQERQDAEIFYLNSITKELESASTEELKSSILQAHPRIPELNERFGKPFTEKEISKEVSPHILRARVCTVTFYIFDHVLQVAKSSSFREALSTRRDQSDTSYLLENQSRNGKKDEILTRTDAGLSQSQQDKPNPVPATQITEKQSRPSPVHSTVEETVQIPLTISTYAIKHIVGRLFDLPAPYQNYIRLIYETDEWDPVNDSSESSDFSSGTDDDEENDSKDSAPRKQKVDRAQKRRDGKSIKRETEIPGGTRKIGDWVEGKSARIRVEIVGVRGKTTTSDG